MDGTFKCAPKITYQLFTIHIFICKKPFPILFALLPNKKLETYKKLFLIIKNKIPNFLPKTIMMDFEHTLILACSEVFSTSQCKGCYFHFTQSIQRKICEKYKANYNKNLDFKLKIKMLCSLAFLPLNKVYEGFYLLSKYIPSDIVKYFQTTYIGYFNNETNLFNLSLFKINFWNITDRIEESLPRTNNYIEGWHNRINSSFMNPHPNIYKFIRKLKEEMDLIFVQIIEQNKGIQIYKSKKYKQIDSNIINLYNEMTSINEQNLNVMDFLKRFSYNIH